mmetsp:Transcript_9470/g.16765  ORF Transcript_9470/g.16765 Transcript_9470/m.16765 type:complete len:408 (+) Transcript_9470:311-1534(+)
MPPKCTNRSRNLWSILLCLRAVDIVSQFNHVHHLYNTSAIRPVIFHGYPTESCDYNFGAPRAWKATPRDVSGAVLFGTRFAQHVIWQRQHPFDCSLKRFIVYFANDNHGIGSTVHCIGQYLSLAMTLGRILILGDGGLWTSGTFCTGARRIDECFFEPLSSCSYDDIPSNISQYDGTHNQTDQFVRADGMKISDWKAVPQEFYKVLRVSGIPKSGWSFWWRCQSSAFIVRPNVRTKQAMDIARSATFNFRIDPGVIAVYIRRGDKITESPGMITSDEPFLLAAEKMWRSNRLLTNSIYLSTEDNATVDYFVANSSWKVMHTNVSRFHEQKSPLTHAKQIGPTVEFINSLVSLDLSLRCDGFVAAMVSNWGRLINELRSTVRCKANHPFSDPEQRHGMQWVLPFKKSV